MSEINNIYNNKYQYYDVNFDEKYDSMKQFYIMQELSGRFKGDNERVNFYWFKRICTLICSLSSDETKLEYINNEKYRYFFYDAIVNGSNFGERIRALIIASLKSDEEKIRQLSSIKDKENVKVILHSLSSDKKIIEYYIKTGDSSILAYLSDDKMKKAFIKYLGLYSSDIDWSIKPDKNDPKTKKISAKRVMSIENEKERYDFIDLVSSDERYIVLASLSGEEYDDIKKIRINEIIKNKRRDKLFIELIKSLSKDEDKVHYIHILQADSELTQELLYTYGKYDRRHFDEIVLEEAITDIVTSFKSDELKFQYLNKLQYDPTDEYASEKLEDIISILSSLGRTYSKRTHTEIVTSFDQLDEETRNRLGRIVITKGKRTLSRLNSEGEKIQEEREAAYDEAGKRLMEYVLAYQNLKSTVEEGLNVLGIPDIRELEVQEEYTTPEQ